MAGKLPGHDKDRVKNRSDIGEVRFLAEDLRHLRAASDSCEFVEATLEQRAANLADREQMAVDRERENSAVRADAVMAPLSEHLEHAIQQAEDRTGRRMIRILTPSFNITPASTTN